MNSEYLIEYFFKKYGLKHLEISVTQVWDHSSEKHTKDFQYQVFTGANKYSCQPSSTIEGAIMNAEWRIKELRPFNQRLRKHQLR
jgi:hypothetical protein